MKQTPAHENYNEHVLKMMPRDVRSLVEVGCSSGALAREYKKLNASAHYLGIEIEPSYAALARRHCDEVLVGDIENMSAEFWERSASRECWIFADVLEHLRDPWDILAKIRNVIPGTGSVVCCIPNIQHWSLLARISVGDFRYEDMGLLDRTHLRWFTRKTILEAFRGARFEIADMRALHLPDERTDRFLLDIGRLAQTAGGNPDETMADARAFQYVVQAVPA